MRRLRSPDDLRADLNPAQWEAVQHAEGPLLILAGAGSGKTRVLAYRIAHLVAFGGVDPGAILALTFTNKAAREMRRRVEDLLGGWAGAAWIGTFHGICLRILRAHGDLLPEGPAFTVYDADDQRKVAAAAIDDLGLDAKRFRPQALLHRVMRAKDEGQGPDEIPLPPYAPQTEALHAFYLRYQERLREARAFDFGDLLVEALRLLRTHPKVADRYRERFRHVLIDEYQDTNRVQYWLAREIIRRHGNLCAVGDDDQSIYGWRGADLRNILSFEKDFPGTLVVKLEQNYRSTAPILEAAASVVSRNLARHPKELWTAREGGEPVRVHEAATEEEEATWVADTLQALRAEGVPHSQVALLYRMHALSRPFEEAFLRRRIPYVVYGGLRFYDRREVKDVLAYLRLVLNPDDPVSFHRIVNTPPRGLGKTTLKAVSQLARERGISPWRALTTAVEEGALATRASRAATAFLAQVEAWREDAGSVPLRDLLGRILEDSGYGDYLAAEGAEAAEERLENLEELLNAAEAFEEAREGTIQDFLDRAALVTDQDLGSDRAEVVTLMTLHAAKGLEYPVVFLAGLEEGVFPHQMSSDTPEALEEERRLCYVGITRAKDRLYLTRARVRRVYGAESIVRLPSRFLAELPPGVYRRSPPGWTAPREDWGSDGVELSAEAVTVAAEPGRRYLAPEPGEADYREGMEVHHPRYGGGSISEVSGRGPRAKVTVRFRDGQTRKFLAAVAGLEVAVDG